MSVIYKRGDELLLMILASRICVASKGDLGLLFCMCVCVLGVCLSAGVIISTRGVSRQNRGAVMRFWRKSGEMAHIVASSVGTEGGARKDARARGREKERKWEVRKPKKSIRR